MEDLLENLTDAQREAVLHVDGPLLILAGPGSGKTRVITHRIAHLIASGIAPRHILALTFTNKAAAEMKTRLGRLVPGDTVWMSTFHRFCAKLLRGYSEMVGLAPNFTIYDTSDSKQALKQAIADFEIDASYYSPERISSVISTAKNHLITYDRFTPTPGDPLEAVVAKVYPAYEKRLLSACAVDFDGLLLHVATLLRDNPLVREELSARHRYVLIDEYQDTNLTQYAIARALTLERTNLCATGDPDQSIYGWRGANLNNILEFERDYPDVRVVRLEQNYRSTRRILRVAQSLITHNRRRKAKDLFTENDEGAAVRLTQYPNQIEEAQSIARRIAGEIQAGRRRPRDFAVFYRTNALSRTIEDAVRREGIPYQIVHSVEFFQRKEVKDVVAYLQLLNNPRDDVAFGRVVNTPPRGIGDRTIECLADHARDKGLSMLESARQAGLIAAVPKRTAVAVAKFVAMFDRISVILREPVEAILGRTLEESGYRQQLADSQTEGDEERLANIQELLTAAREFDHEHGGEGTLEEFLEHVCLVNDTDDWEAGDDRMTLMTLHAAKGLEFPVVSIVAVEQGLLPHELNRESPHKMEEERRLFFVGITRAMEELWLSHVQIRDFRGRRNYAVPSSFLFELPREEMEIATVQSERAANGFAPLPAELDGDSDFMPAPLEDFELAVEGGDTSFDFGAAQPKSPPVKSELDDELPSTPVPTPAPAPRIRPAGVKFQTAAELAGVAPSAAARPSVAVEVFEQGMAVMHPEYGVGKILALSGEGISRKATVVFVGFGEKRFVLSKSPLRPARPR